MRRHHLVIPLAALIAVSPLLFFGTSCGHDIGFHLQNWVEAAAQLRHGTLYPRWAFSAAWQTGEPRFIFYPPLSWMFGALLSFVLPIAATPNAFIYIAIVAAGFSMYAVARRFTNPNAALLAACVYLANPYMFFNAFERSAYAELLASVWIPLLFLAVMSRRPSVTTGAAAVALAWLTNVPAGIMATYTFVLLAGTRLFFDRQKHDVRPSPASHPQPSVISTEAQLPTSVISTGAQLPTSVISTGAQLPTSVISTGAQLPTSVISTGAQRSGETPVSRPDKQTPLLQASTAELGAFRHHALSLTTALILGLAVPGFYLLPAAAERRFVQSSMLMIENLRYQDNFLFHNTKWEPHNIVTHAVSLVAVAMLIPTACLLAVLFLQSQGYIYDPEVRRTRIALTALFSLILFLLLPVSGFVWHITPELPFLQFPWRLLTVLAAVLALALALTLRTWQARPWLAALVGLLYVALTTPIASHLYRQACEIPHYAQYTLDTFHAQHGIPPTDEYTPGDADNDLLRTGSPGYWLAPASNPAAYAPGTVPNPNEYDPLFDGPIPYAYTWAHRAPTHLDLNLPQPAVLVLNLRDFPDWRITRNGATAPRHIRRDDGLTAIPLPAGPSHIDVAWHRGWDVYAGDALTLAALGAVILLRRRFRDPNSIPTVN